MKARPLPVVSLAALLLAACGSLAGAPASTTGERASGGSSAASAKAAAQSSTKLVVSYGELVPQSVPVFLAKDAGVYQQNGLDVDLQLIVSSAEIPALIAGETQFSSGGGAHVLNAAAAGADVVVLGAVAGLSPFRLYVQPSIKSVRELKGKNVGISKFGSPSEVALRVVLRKNGMDPEKDVRFVELGSTQARTAALIQKTIDGGMANPLEAAQLEKNGLVSLYDLAKEKTPSAQSLIIGRRDWVNGHREVVQRYVDAVSQALVKTHQDKALTVGIMKKWFKSDDEPLMASIYDAYTTTGLWPAGAPYATPQMFDDAKETVGAAEPKVRDLDLSKMIDSSFVKNAEDRGLSK